MNGKDLFIGLGDISQKYYEKAEMETISPAVTRRPLRKPVLIAAIIAAMLLLVGCVYTALNGADWFRNFFEESIQQPLSPGQNEFIDQNTIEVNQSDTVNGYTLTIESAIADSRNAYIKLRLTSAPGTVLNGEFYGYTHQKTPDGEGFERTFYKADDPGLLYGAGTWQTLEDDDPNDNSVSILWALNQTGENAPPFEENVLYKIYLPNWVVSYPGETGCEPFIENDAFELSLSFPKLNQDSLSFISTPVPTAYGEFAVEITSFQLNTMSGSATYTGRNDEKGVLCLFESFVKLNNGTEVSINPRQFGPGYCDFVLASPVSLSEVDYVQLRDGTRLYAAEP